MKENMDDGEVELSNNIQSGLSSDSFLDDFFKNSQTCTHTHTCNPPGPNDAAHTHTCHHTHTRVIPSEEGNGACDKHGPGLKPRKPLGNREAVRKYREKKKAHAAYLEEEVKKLRVVNQHLMRRLQRQAMLETEVVRLRALLVDLRGKIDKELGDFPFEPQCNNPMSVLKEGECGIPDECGKMMAGWGKDCVPTVIDCIGNDLKFSGDPILNLASSANREE